MSIFFWYRNDMFIVSRSTDSIFYKNSNYKKKVPVAVNITSKRRFKFNKNLISRTYYIIYFSVGTLNCLLYLKFRYLPNFTRIASLNYRGCESCQSNTLDFPEKQNESYTFIFV